VEVDEEENVDEAKSPGPMKRFLSMESEKSNTSQATSEDGQGSTRRPFVLFIRASTFIQQK
jgi:hypothetical protein